MKALASLIVAVATCLPAVASAQAFPNKPLTIIVPFAAGGGTDAIARDLAKQLGDRLKQPVIIDNRGGAGGSIGAQAVQAAKPDGHTLLFVTSTFVTAAATDRKLPYDIVRDFTPIAMLGRGPLLLVVSKQSGIASVADLIAAAKKAPDSLNYVSAGTGSINHLSGELFVQRTGVKMTHVPYKGSGPATTDLIGGQAQVFFATVPTILGQVKADRVNLLATTGKARSPLFLQAPTVIETGVRDFDVSTWWGVVGPKGLAPEITAALNTAINESAASEAIGKRFVEEGAQALKGTPADFGAVIQQELDAWRKVVHAAGIKID